MSRIYIVMEVGEDDEGTHNTHDCFFHAGDEQTANEKLAELQRTDINAERWYIEEIDAHRYCPLCKIPLKGGRE